MRLHIVAALFASLLGPCVARPQAFSQLVITPSGSTQPGESRLQVLPGGRISGHSIPVIELLSLAYSVPSNPSPRLSSPPEWTDGRRFDLEATTAVPFRFTSDDPGKQTQEIQQLMQRFLADGFGLVLNEKRERMPVYALVRRKSGVKLSPARKSGCIFDTGPDGCRHFAPGFGHPLNGRAVSMSDLASYLENWTDLPVVNRTGLTGRFTLHSPGWRPMVLPPPPPGTAASGNEFASLPSLSAVLEKFGLALRQEAESLPRYTVERIREPAMK